MPRIRLGLLLLGLVLVVAPWTEAAERALLNSALDSIRADDLKRHVYVLADDSFEGRSAGSRGGRAAAVYCSKEFERAQLLPAGTNGSWFQPFQGNQRNILGRIEGSDPQLKHEYLVIGAHYDHVGYGTPQNSYGPYGLIHNGADDNASGTAALIEVAEAFMVSGLVPRRSILFVLWDGEEQGLEGSKYWMAQPTVPLSQVKFGLNLDMIGRLRQQRLEVYGARSGYGLRRLVAMRAGQHDLWLDFSWEMEANSDHWSFFDRGIPTLMFHTGKHDDYHRPSDDAHKINYKGMQQITRLLMEVTNELANRETSIPFRVAARSEGPATRLALEQPVPHLPPRLGVVWDEQDQRAPGLRITRVIFDTPADSAGVRAGDRLLTFNGEVLESGEQLRQAVLVAPTQIEVTVSRPGQAEPVTLPIQLAGKPVRVGIAWREDDAEPNSVLLTRVVPGAPAARAGLRVGDRLYQVDGRDVTSRSELLAQLSAASGPTSFLVERGGRVTTVELDLPPSPIAAAESEATVLNSAE